MLYREFLHCTVNRKEGGGDWGPGIICSDAAPGTYASRSVGLLKFLGTAKAASPAAVALLNPIICGRHIGIVSGLCLQGLP